MEDLDNAALSELKSFIRPPVIVLNVVKAALLLLGHPLDTIRVATPLTLLMHMKLALLSCDYLL